MIQFLLLLFLIFILVPVIRIALAIYSARRKSQRMWQQFNNTAQSYRRQQQQRADTYYQGRKSQAKKKKIGRDVGEYIDFEDLPGSTEQSEESSSKTVYHEQQVTDAEWEEIS